MEDNLTMDIENKDTKEGKHKKPVNWKKEILSWGLMLVIAFVVANIVTRFVIIKAEVPTMSMENTIMTGDRLIGNRLAYLFSSPERGDIIIFEFPDDRTQDYIKRVIGLPGESLEIIDGKVYINGSTEPLEENYLPEIMEGSFGPYQVPEDCYFMMGDNRNYSGDARYWDTTYISKDDIIAKAMFRYYPSLGWID